MPAYSASGVASDSTYTLRKIEGASGSAEATATIGLAALVVLRVQCHF
jgi:hypothetical protein